MENTLDMTTGRTRSPRISLVAEIPCLRVSAKESKSSANSLRRAATSQASNSLSCGRHIESSCIYLELSTGSACGTCLGWDFPHPLFSRRDQLCSYNRLYAPWHLRPPQRLLFCHHRYCCSFARVHHNIYRKRAFVGLIIFTDRIRRNIRALNGRNSENRNTGIDASGAGVRNGWWHCLLPFFQVLTGVNSAGKNASMCAGSYYC